MRLVWLLKHIIGIINVEILELKLARLCKNTPENGHSKVKTQHFGVISY